MLPRIENHRRSGGASPILHGLLAALTLCTAAAVALAQPGVRFGRFAAADPANPDLQQGVYVRDSAVAADKFELGKRMERLKEWPKSADVYQEILQKYQDRVVPVAYDEQKRPIRYASVTVAVQESLARWPQEGLAVYRQKYEPAASLMLEQIKSGDNAALHRLFSQYFVTDAARQAGLRLMDQYLESGEFTVAGWIGDRLLDWHPNLGADRPRVLFRTAVAYHLCGNAAAAQKRLEELKAKFPDAKDTIAGQEANLVSALADQLNRRPPAARLTSGDSYITFGGDDSRSLLPVASGYPGARVYSVDLPGPNVANLPDRSRREVTSALESARNLGLSINVIPVADRGELFFQDGYRIYALHLESGVPLPGWAQTYSGQRMGQFNLPVSPNELAMAGVADNAGGSQLYTPTQNTLTLTDDAVLAVMGSASGGPVQLFPGAPAGVRFGGTRLACLDRATGKQRWIIAPRSAAGDQASNRNLDFSGAPLVVGDNVYVIARGSTAAGVEDCHVQCYSLADGALRFSCYIASSGLGTFNMGGMPVNAGIDDDVLSHLAFDSGRIFVLTNLGAVAAIDAYSGATAWLSIYPRDEKALDAIRQRAAAGMGGWAWQQGGSATTGRPGTNSWDFNAVILHDGKVFILPTDGKYLMVYDAASGQELKRIPRELSYAGENRKLTMLLAVMGENIIAASKDFLFQIDWAKYKVPADDEHKIDDAAVVPSVGPMDIKGRPFVTASRIYVPTAQKLKIAELPSMRITDGYPRGNASWLPEEGPGNVLVTQDHVIIANARNVAVYTDLRGIRQKYLAAIQASPGDIDAHLTFSELMFNAREYKDALPAMDKAIEFMGGLKSLRPGALRERLFNDALLFAQRVGQSSDETTIAIANQLFDRAQAAAQSPTQQVNYCIARARFIESLKAVQKDPDYALAVRLYQQILLNPEMRAILLSGDDGTSVPAGQKADSAIADLILKAGPAVYQPFEQQAAAELSALAKNGDPDVFLALADKYPHATAAPQALMHAAELYEKASQPRLSILVLRRVYWKYQQRYTGEGRARLAEAMARNYLALGNVGAALGRLQAVDKLLPIARLSQPLKDSHGLVVQFAGHPAQTIHEAAESLRSLASVVLAESLPDVHLPPPLTTQERLAHKQLTDFAAGSVLPNVHAIIEPPVDLREHANSERLVAWSGGQLACYAPGADRPLWTSQALAECPTSLLWLGNDLLVWNALDAALLDGQSGKPRWRVDLKSLPALDSVTAALPAENNKDAAADAAAQDDGPAGIEQRLLNRRNRAIEGRLLLQAQAGRINVVNGNVVLLPGGQLVIQGGGIAVGGPVEIQPADGRERIRHIRPLSDRLIITTTAPRVIALDLEQGKSLWQARLPAQTLVNQTLATDDFTVLRLSEDSVSGFLVLDSFSGQQVLRKRFAPQRSNTPQNAVLAPNGMLVWTTAASIAGKDLYESGDALTWEHSDVTFAGLSQPDQLLVFGQDVLAVCNGGKFVTRRSLATGAAIATLNANGDPNSPPRLRLSGPRLCVYSQRCLISYHLEYGTSVTLTPASDGELRPLASQPLLMLTRDFIIVPAAPQSAAANATYCIQAYSRAMIPNPDTNKPAESGLLTHFVSVTEPAKIKAWSAVAGGLYYLANDDRLHFLRGTRP